MLVGPWAGMSLAPCSLALAGDLKPNAMGGLLGAVQRLAVAPLDMWRPDSWRTNAGSSRLLQKQQSHPRLHAVQALGCRRRGGAGSAARVWGDADLDKA